jgi:hypothetical protein
MTGIRFVIDNHSVEVSASAADAITYTLRTLERPADAPALALADKIQMVLLAQSRHRT